MAFSDNTFKTGNTTWHVNVRNHRFYATAPGFTEVSGVSWDEMESRAKVAASKAKVKVSVPYVYTTVKGPDRKFVFVRRTATGIHAGSGNVLYTDAHGSGQETYGYSSSGFMEPFSGEDGPAYLDLLAQRAALDNRISEIEKRYRFESGLKAEVEKAINAEHARRAGGSDAAEAE